MNEVVSKILIVDDNTFYLSVLKTILRNIDAEIFMASSGEEALKLFEQNEFALAILDIEMPEMDGFDLADRIRKYQNRDLLPIIFLTAYMTDDVQMYKGYDKGAIDYLTKPINKDIFISKVNVFLELDKQKKTLKAAKQETEESRKKYFKLYDFAPTGYLTISSKGEILDINLKGASLLNIETGPAAKYNIKTAVSPASMVDFENFISEVFGQKTHSKCEIALKPLKGRTTYVFLQGALTDEGDSCLVSMADITDRREAQMALQESEELYHSLLKTSPDGIIITDLNGQITEASIIATEILGVNDQKLEGTHLTDYIPRNSRRALISICQSTKAEGMIQNIEIKLNRADKSEFNGEVSCSQIRGNSGEIKAYMSVIRDISERKLIEKQLRHSERMAGIGELATGMAHEINQPLNTISLSIDNIIFSLDNSSLTENYLRTKLNKVFDNITRIKKIIDHVRTFSRDQDDFIHSAFNINLGIENSISMISEQFQQKEIDLNFTPDNNIPEVAGNPYRFEQVIVNMLINAKDAIEERRKKTYEKFDKKIDIHTNRIDNQIIIEIKDNGIGIKPEEIDKVLLPFFTTKAPGQGTGLGLSISYGIIKELGGEIDIKSQPLAGTSIFLKIPVRESKNKIKA